MYLTICIPTFNRGNFLKDTLSSIYNKINSKLDCFEVIVLDNFSNDNTFDVVNEFQQQFENLVYKKNESNFGAAINIINCMKMANGEYIKLINDTAILEENSIDFLIFVIIATLICFPYHR